MPTPENVKDDGQETSFFLKNKRWVIITLSSLLGLFIVVSLLTIIWGSHLNHTITERLSGKRWAAPTEFYSAPERFVKGQSRAKQTLTDTLERLEYKPVLIDRPLRTAEFARWNAEVCRQRLGTALPSEVVECFAWRPRVRADYPPGGPERQLQVAAVQGDDVIFDVFEGDPPKPASVIDLEPELFAQFYGGQPVLRRIISLSDVPPHVLNAILAAEDSNFLSHHGVSWTGMARAAMRDITKGRIAEGGSTITQQLIKNYFLDSRRNFKRKITEILMALLLESQFSKDDILETYINEVYLGQEGPFEVHGIGVAAKYFFNKDSSDLSVAEGALIAGVIRGPNIYSPFTHAERSLARRNQVLKRMGELNLITADELKAALQEPLPKPREQLLRDLAPFFVDAVKFQIHKMKIPDEEGLQVFTTLNLRAQRDATQAVTAGLGQIEKQYANIQKLEKKYNAKLQAALISADPTNGFVQAVVGGRAYTETQLNRAVQSRRQVGSIFKPFVYMTALSNPDPSGNNYTPMTVVDDTPFTVTYDRQSWTPQNDDDIYMGNVPIYVALAHSLNAATAKVALQVGIQKIMTTAQHAGIDSPLVPFPSLALGVAPLTPFEVLQAYSTFARRGELNPLTFIYKIIGPGHNVLYEFQPSRGQVLDPIDSRITVSMMQQVLEIGTGQLVRKGGFTYPAAGKTGTTSDTKDSWFGGFTPLHAAVVWVGFDQPQRMGLTGALGALPIWLRYMQAYATTYPPIDFAVPDGAVQVDVDTDTGTAASAYTTSKASLVFRKGTEPH